MTNRTNAIRKGSTIFAILCVAAFGLTACGGGGGSPSPGGGRPGDDGDDDMMVKPDVVACSYTHNLGSAPTSLCEEIVGGRDADYCGALRALPANSNVRSVNRCSRSGTQLVCRWKLTSGGSREHYYYSGDREEHRSGCERAGGTVVGGTPPVMEPPTTNRAPTARGSIPDQTLGVGESVTIDLSRYFTDPDGDRLTYSLLSRHSDLHASISGSILRIQLLRAPGLEPSRSIEVTATDHQRPPWEAASGFPRQRINVNVRSNNGGGEPPRGGGTVTGVIEDACNDGSAIQYRFFHYRRADTPPDGRWPDSGGGWQTRRYGESYTHARLACTSGYLVCYGGRTGNSSWGVGYDGVRGCTRCCVACPSSGSVRLTGRLGC